VGNTYKNFPDGSYADIKESFLNLRENRLTVLSG